MPATRREYWLAKMRRNRRRDRIVRRRLRRSGWDVLVVWECQTADLTNLCARLLGFLRAR